jgi:large subunit ribosomal protein L25
VAEKVRKEIRINAEPRTEFGKGAARRARRAGMIPAVLYGRGSQPVHLSLPDLDFARALREHGRNAVLTLATGNDTQLALPKTVVTHPIRNYIEHVDLLVIKRGERVTVEVPVSVTGEAAPGTLVYQEVDRLEIASDVSSIPDAFAVSVDNAEVGTQVLAGHVVLPEGVELRGDPEQLVVNVVAAPTESDLEAQVDVEGAGVVEEAPEGEEPAPEPEATATEGEPRAGDES